jgi:hypothetical protein
MLKSARGLVSAGAANPLGGIVRHVFGHCRRGNAAINL